MSQPNLKNEKPYIVDTIHLPYHLSDRRPILEDWVNGHAQKGYRLVNLFTEGMSAIGIFERQKTYENPNF